MSEKYYTPLDVRIRTCLYLIWVIILIFIFAFNTIAGVITLVASIFIAATIFHYQKAGHFLSRLDFNREIDL